MQADGATPALSADAEGTLGRLEGMLMSASQQHAKFEKKVELDMEMEICVLRCEIENIETGLVQH